MLKKLIKNWKTEKKLLHQSNMCDGYSIRKKVGKKNYFQISL